MLSTPRTLSDLTYEVASLLKTLREGTTTSASISAIIDSNRAESDDYWNLGPVWILETPSGSVPMGEFGVVSDFGGGTITLRSSVSATIPVGALYAVGRRRFPLDIIQQSINSALLDLGKVPQIDTSIETTTQTTQYTIPAGARLDLREVWLQTVLNITNDLGWMMIPKGYWRQESTLLFMPQAPIERTLKLVYVNTAAPFTGYSNTLSPYIHPKRIVYKAAFHALDWRAERIVGDVDAIRQKQNYFLDLDQRAAAEHPIHMPPKRNAMYIPREGDSIEDNLSVPPYS